MSRISYEREGQSVRGKPPLPISKAFLICNRLSDDSKTGQTTLVGLPCVVVARFFPVAYPLAFFARWASAHGVYQVEVQLQHSEGEVLWRAGPPKPWLLTDPLRDFDLKLSLLPVFPKPGSYDFVLLANDEEVSRQRFFARLKDEPERS